MSDLTAFGLGAAPRSRPDGAAVEYVLIQRPLQKIMAFRGRTIDDIVNDRIVKIEIYGYWKLDRQIMRSNEIVDLERQWSAPAVIRH
jgi:hypothetical protein